MIQGGDSTIRDKSSQGGKRRSKRNHKLDTINKSEIMET